LKEQKGVSPVVGTILLIAVTVALAAVVATLVGGLGGGAIAPTATLNVTAKYVDNTHVKITITHNGGDALALDKINIIADDGAETQASTLLATGTSNSLTVGHSVTLENYIVTSINVNDTISVKLIHTPSSQMIFNKSDVLVSA
jgi:flagellin-like protein